MFLACATRKSDGCKTFCLKIGVGSTLRQLSKVGICCATFYPREKAQKSLFSTPKWGMIFWIFVTLKFIQYWFECIFLCWIHEKSVRYRHKQRLCIKNLTLMFENQEIYLLQNMLQVIFTLNFKVCGYNTLSWTEVLLGTECNINVIETNIIGLKGIFKVQIESMWICIVGAERRIYGTMYVFMVDFFRVLRS